MCTGALSHLQGPPLAHILAAPGTHIEALSKMFPEAHFVVVDPAPFTVRFSSKVEIIQDIFTDDFARQLSHRSNVLFISDIRTADPNRVTLRVTLWESPKSVLTHGS